MTSRDALGGAGGAERSPDRDALGGAGGAERSPDRDALGGAGGAERSPDRDAIEPLITRLVQTAPALEPATVDALVSALREIGSPLALSIARVAELVAEQLVDPGIALPPLAMACATLVDGIRGKVSSRELEAARYEIETLMPVPDRPDVPVTALRRKP